MIGFSWATLACAALIVTVAYVVYGLTGFGASIVAIPLLVHFFSLRFAVPMMLVFDLFAGTLLGLRNRRHLSKPELFRLLPYLAIGMVCGVTLLIRVPERWLLLGLGIFIFAYATWSLLNRLPPSLASTRWALPAGLVGGAFTALYGTGGPIYTIYLARRLSDKNVLRATIGVLIFCTALIRLVLFSGSGLYAQPGLLTLAAALLPFALVGYLMGSALHLRLATAQAVRAVWLLLLLSGAGLALRAMAMP
ncbi:MAG: sulfite exporter TauE/SafE family protein [Pseudomonadota bacterium]|nr:sulfite exporter TauE/SafE family protein [Pseudomonadota bacterium]